MSKKLVTFALSSGLAAMALKVWIKRETRRASAQREQARAIQRWEDEGGNPAPATSNAD